MEPEPCPFTILIDSAEQHPWTFKGMKCDAKKKYRPLAVSTRWESLGRHPNSKGDYSIEGYEYQVAVERKSADDCRGTILGWPSDNEPTGRRQRFERELENLHAIGRGCVIVEGTFEDVVQNVPDYGKKTRETQAKILFRSIVAYQQDYNVPWFFCGSRRFAELTAFRWLERFWRKWNE